MFCLKQIKQISDKISLNTVCTFSFDKYGLDQLARDKSCGLYWLFVNNSGKKFYNFDTGAQCYKAFYVSNLQMFIKSKSVCAW